ncbi:MAG TPA: phosphoenolpyruvate carboxylase [Bacteriovoracaceae bacterium]|nr:phosphoenolpyruvate carboxylase [Bacteriovoracaceae bacterium]
MQTAPPPSIIPEDLKGIISKSVKILGQGVKDIYGLRMYEKVEDLRLRMKDVRGRDASLVERSLDEIYLELKTSSNDELHKVAKAFSLMLELINACEAAYRSFRLADYQTESHKKPHSLVYVFTSHPTEARSKDFLFLMDKIESLLLQSFRSSFEEIEEKIYHLLKISLKLDLANNRRPQVKDEADQIFHIVLDHSILSEQIALRQKGINVFFRTWVGGDKDGHPKVGPLTMLQSFNLSRGKLLEFIQEKVTEYEQEVALIDPVLHKTVKALKLELKKMKLVGANDGKKLKALNKSYQQFLTLASKKQLLSPALRDVADLIWLYPALVLPLEIREDQELIHAALTDPRQPIARMLAQLKKIAAGVENKWYVRGFIISMCQESRDLLAAMKLTKKMLGSFSLPVVPLFENEKGLSNSVKILTEAFAEFDFIHSHHKSWNGKFEVMLGYSDSSKENGVLPGRLLVQKALLELEEFLLKKSLTPVFFHGSGGSVSRGGGSIKEQIAWWPQSALNIYKVTVQGETVQRHFHQPLIMRSQVGKIVDEFSNYRPRNLKTPPKLPVFAKAIQDEYRSLVKDPEFQELVSRATPYDFLNLLKIGSRPTKRSGKGAFTIRAIPWILCWTQTRLLLPFWWGTGSAWAKLDLESKEEIKTYYKDSPLMHSYVKNLGFTFAKIELGVWNFHVEHSTLAESEKHKWKVKIQDELLLSKGFFRDLTADAEFTWFRPKLGESIVFRSSMIHPLNVIQKLALERKDNVLLRETVTGIACGMLTTG